MKKALKIVGIVIVVILIVLIAVPFLFQDQIEQKLKEAINENVNAKVEWESLRLSLLKSFPSANIDVKELSVINIAPFEGDTLAYAKDLQLEMGIVQLITSDALRIEDIYIENADVNLIVNEDGVSNYDIAKPSEEQTTEKSTSEESNFSLELKSYEIKDSRIKYASGETIALELNHINHSGKGDFSKNIFVLNTHTDSEVLLNFDNTKYLNHTTISLDADLAMDLDQMKFSFKDNKAYINKLPLHFNGFVKVNENNQEIDLNFNSIDSDFKNLIAVIPEEYSASLSEIETRGNFDLNGKITGIVDETYIPKLDINVLSKNAMMNYTSLPKQFENINIDLKVENLTGLVDDTKVNLNTFSFNLGKDQFSGSAYLTNLTKNLKTDLIAKGILNLDNLAEAYPIDTDLTLNGIIKADIETHFDMESIEKEQYQNIKTNGVLEAQNFVYTSENFNNPVNISTAKVSFDDGITRLQNLEMETGQTDLKVQGNLQNLIGYLVNNQDLKGNFNASSNTFNVNDFLTEVEGELDEENSNTPVEDNTSGTEAFNLPDKLDLSLKIDADKVIYDTYTLQNTHGELVLKPKAAFIKELESNIFDGKVSLDGDINTATDNPKFKMDLKLENIDIVSAVDDVKLLQSFTPILKSLIGRLSTEFDFSGDLTNDLTPILTSLRGKGLTNIITAKIDTQQYPLASQLNSSITGLDLNNYTLENVLTTFSFQDGSVNIKPLSFNVEDINVTLQGNHSLENSMNYQAQLDIPAKYLGDDLGNQLAKLTKTDLDNMKVNLPIGITGALGSPKIQLDYQAAVNNLKSQIINQQKDDLINQAGDTVKDLLGKEVEKDSTSNVKEDVKNVLGGLLGGKKKKDKEKDNE